MDQQQNTIEQYKDQVLLLPNGDLIYEMMVTTYDLGHRNGYLEAEEKYKPVLEDFKKLVTLIRRQSNYE